MRKPKQYKARGYDGVFSPQRKALDIYEVDDQGRPMSLIKTFDRGVRNAAQAESIFHTTINAIAMSKLRRD